MQKKIYFVNFKVIFLFKLHTFVVNKSLEKLNKTFVGPIV